MRPIVEIETEHPEGPVYLWFAEKGDAARSEISDNPEVVVDYDANENVIGVELITTTPDEIETLAKIAKRHNLALTALFARAA